MELNNEMKIKELIYMNHAAKVKKELMADLGGVLEGLSASVFLPLTEVPLEDKSGVLDTEDIFRKFKSNVEKKIQENFNTMWDSYAMSESVAALECLKEETPDKSAVQWRPTGKTPKEQIRPYVVKGLQKKCLYLDKQNDYQENLFEEYVMKVMEVRQKIDSHMDNRAAVLDQIKVHQKQLREELAESQVVDRCDEILDEILE